VTLVAGGAATVKPITTYFRKTFSIADRALIGTATVNLLRDDGAVVYVNGVEAFRSNMPTGVVSWTTLATLAIANADETTFFPFTVSPTLFVSGTNVIAVELHQQATSSSDISFDMELVCDLPGASPSSSSSPPPPPPPPPVVISMSLGPYLQLATPSSMTVCFRTTATAVGVVRYGASPSTLTSSASSPAAGTVHAVTIAGLTPATLYYYDVASVSGVAATTVSSFRTPPLAGSSVGSPFRIWAIGDAGAATAAQSSVRNAFLALGPVEDTDMFLQLGVFRLHVDQCVSSRADSGAMCGSMCR
jgi:hypothetical protein